MRAYSSANILFSLHIPKAGGTSFNDVLRKWFWPGFHSHYFRHDVNKMPFRPKWFKWGLHYLQVKPMCIHGHFEEEAGVFECYPRASQFITVVRDPLELQISMFFDHQKRLGKEALFWKGKSVEMEYKDIDQWVEERPNFLLKFFPWQITTSNYKEIINDHFIHIGITEELQKSIDIFAQKFGKASINVPRLNDSPRSMQPSESAIRKFKHKHKLEYELYNYICGLNG